MGVIMVNKQGVINFTLSDEVKIAIEQLAKKRQISEGAICRYAITKYLENEIVN